MKLAPVDLAVVFAYLAICAGVGAWLARKVKGLESYYLGERSIPTWALLVSIVATETSTATFLSVPSLSFRAEGSMVYLQLALGLMLGRVVVSVFLLPAYFRGQVFTAYQVLQERLGPGVQRLGAILFLISRTLGGGLRLWLGAMALSAITGWSEPVAIVAAGLTTLAYTYMGGMRAVVWTDVMQFFIYVAGALFCLVWIIRLVPGGWGHIALVAQQTGRLRMFDFSCDPSQPFTFWAGLIGGMVLNTATHGTEQLMVQRYLSARSLRSARTALVLSGLFVFAQFTLFLVLGIALFTFLQGTPRETIKPDRAFLSFIVNDLPRNIGVAGLLVAAVLSSTMSSLSSSLNAASSCTVNDLLKPFYPGRDERFWLRMARILTLAWGAIEILVALGAMGLKETVIETALAIASFVAGILLGLFVLGQFPRKIDPRAAVLGAASGLAVVSYLAFGKHLPHVFYPWQTKVAWTWYALAGSLAVSLVGLVGSRLPWGQPLSVENPS